MKRILVCNDDGIHAAGIRALVEVLEPIGEVTVMAPAVVTVTAPVISTVIFHSA